MNPDAAATARHGLAAVEDSAERVHLGRREDERRQVDDDRRRQQGRPVKGGTGTLFIDDIGYGVPAVK